VLIPHGFNLGLSALRASLTLIVNNFNYDQNLTKIFLEFILHTLMYQFMKKKINFLKILDQEGPLNQFPHVLMAIIFSSYISQIILCALAALLFW